MKAIGARWLVWALLRASSLCLVIGLAASEWLSSRARRLFPVAGINGWMVQPVAAGRRRMPNPWVRS